MPAWRLSRLQQRILRWLAADHQRTRGMIVSSHEDLVKGLPADKGHLSRSLRTLEEWGRDGDWSIAWWQGATRHAYPGRVAESLRKRKKVVHKALSQ